MYLHGFPFDTAINAKQLLMDDSLFCGGERSRNRMSNLEYYDDLFLFYRCKLLECLSIRNAKYMTSTNLYSNEVVVGEDIPQND